MVSIAHVTKVLKFPNYNLLQILLDGGKTPGPTTFIGKSSLSVASRVD